MLGVRALPTGLDDSKSWRGAVGGRDAPEKLSGSLQAGRGVGSLAVKVSLLVAVTLGVALTGVSVGVEAGGWGWPYRCL